MVLAEEESVVQKPAGLSWERAAVLAVVGVTALQAVRDKGRLQSGQAVFVHGCLGSVGRAATQLAISRGASVAGSCRPTATADAEALGVAPIVEFAFDPAPLADRFDVVFDTVGNLPSRTTSILVKPGGRIIDINPTVAKLARTVLPGPFGVLVGKASSRDLGEVAQAASRGTLDVPVALSVPLTDAIEALVELETDHKPKGGKVVVTIV